MFETSLFSQREFSQSNILLLLAYFPVLMVSVHRDMEYLKRFHFGINAAFMCYKEQSFWENVKSGAFHPGPKQRTTELPLQDNTKMLHVHALYF